MKFVIKHEIKGRLRVHMAQQRMTYEQADVLQYYLQQSDLVVDAKVYEQTADVVISYNGDRAAMIHLLCTFKYQMDRRKKRNFSKSSDCLCCCLNRV